jgi:predicted deacetylase
MTLTKARQIEDHVALISLHDVTPAFENDVLISYDRLNDLGISSFTLLVTPLYGQKKSNTLSNHELFCEYLRSLNLEMSLHGYTHVSKSGNSNEFRGIPQEKVVQKIRSSIALFRKGLGEKPVGFVPPLWNAPKRVLDAVGKLGLDYCVVGNRLHTLSPKNQYESAVLVVGQEGSASGQIGATVEIELGGSVQIAVHPRDHVASEVFNLIADMRDRLGYKFVGYRDYLLSF